MTVWRSWRNPPASLAVALLLLACASPLLIAVWLRAAPVLGLGPAVYERTHHLESHGDSAYTVWLLLVLVGPVLEELIFRAGLTRWLLRRTSESAAIVIGAVAFAAAHGVAQSGDAFIVGLLLGLVYARTANFWLCVLFHVTSNGLAAFLGIWMTEDEILAQAFDPGWLVARAAALIIGLVLLNRGLNGLRHDGLPAWRVAPRRHGAPAV